MFIQTEQTPNPATLKFIPGRQVMMDGTAHFSDSEAGKASPLAKRLFAVDGVTGVFLGSDFISVTRQQGKDWPHIKPAILAAILAHYESGDPIMEKGDDKSVVPDVTESGDDNAVVAQIKELLDTRVRPSVAMDGGDITFRLYEDGVVYLEMRGACQGCPSSSLTLQAGIENMLRHYIPEVQEVRAVV